MRRKLLVIVALGASLGLPVHAEQAVRMHGFQVEFEKVGRRSLERMRSSLERQLQIVEEARVPASVLEYFRTVPVVIVPELNTGLGRARLDQDRQIVELKAADLPRDRPILLHELLHAYHGQKLGRTAIILKSFRQAKRSGIYPKRYANAHFLENPGEYFVVIGSIFLYGKIDQPPYDCQIPAKEQPELITFLEQQFGPHACR